jgi:hypothetical protein
MKPNDTYVVAMPAYHDAPIDLVKESLYRQATRELAGVFTSGERFTVKMDFEFPDEVPVPELRWRHHPDEYRLYVEMGRVHQRHITMPIFDELPLQSPPPVFNQDAAKREARRIWRKFKFYWTAKKRQQEINVFCGRRSWDDGTGC